MTSRGRRRGGGGGGEAICGFSLPSDLLGVPLVESFPLSGCTSATSSAPRIDFTDVGYDLTSFALNVDVDGDGDQLNELICFFGDVTPLIVSQTFSTHVSGSNTGPEVLVGCFFTALGKDGLTEVDYRLLVSGVADGAIPPAPGTATTVILVNWQIERIGGPGRKVACEGEGFFPLSDSADDIDAFGFPGPVVLTVFGPPEENP